MFCTGDVLLVTAISALAVATVFPLLIIDNKNFVNKVSSLLAISGCLCLLFAALSVFQSGSITIVLGSWPPLGNVNIVVDSLSAFFLLIIGVIGVAVSCFALNYNIEFLHRRLNILLFLFNGFILSMVMVLTAHNVMCFLIAWEIMTILSFLLVNHDHENIVSNRSAFFYFAVASLGTVFIIMAFLILWMYSGNMDFATLVLQKEKLNIGILVFLFALVGFGAKAGLFPLHFWLPMAHPVAPTPVSALMSGVMLKISIYGLLRFLIYFLANIILPAWCGVLVITLAVCSCIIGVVGSLKTEEVKKVLAYSSVENVGFIFMGIGTAILFINSGRPWLAALAWLATFYHIFNHSLYKSLMFMGAGFIIQKTHEHNMNKMGGLIKYLPYMSVAMLIGVMSMVALPPFNGFYSEWLLFKSLASLQLAMMGNSGKLLTAFCISAFALTAALAMASFLRLYACIFLSKIRDVEVKRNMQKTIKEKGTEPLAVVLPLFTLGALCILLGVYTAPVTDMVSIIFKPLNSVDVNMLQEVSGVLFAFNNAEQSYTGMMPVLLLICFFLLFTMGIYYLHGKARRYKSQTWGCGIELDPQMTYNATAFAMPLVRVFSFRKLDNKFLLSLKTVKSMTRKGTIMFKKMQAGSGHYYIGYILVATAAMLIFSARW